MAVDNQDVFYRHSQQALEGVAAVDLARAAFRGDEISLGDAETEDRADSGSAGELTISHEPPSEVMPKNDNIVTNQNHLPQEPARPFLPSLNPTQTNAQSLGEDVATAQLMG